MPRPTIAAIRRVLEDLGVPQVDPSSWFDGTMPEILRAVLDMGPIAPLPTLNRVENLTFASAPNTVETFNITSPVAGTFEVVKNLTIDIVTPNINDIRLQTFDGATTNRLWRDVGTPLFGIGQYIGTDNDATRAWGAFGLDNVVLYPPELTQTPGAQRQLQIRLESGAAEVKTVTISVNITTFDSRLFAGGDW